MQAGQAYYGIYLRHGSTSTGWADPNYNKLGGANYVFFDGHAEFRRDIHNIAHTTALHKWYYQP